MYFLPGGHRKVSPAILFMKVRLFIDFWNFQLNWNKRANGDQPDWTRLPGVLTREAGALLQKAGLGMLSLEEIRVYASYEPGRESSLRGWLHNFLDKQPGFRVFAVERRWKKHTVHCRSCGQNFAKCPSCQAELGRAAEKTIDSRIVTDLLSFAWEGAYEVALLLRVYP